MIIDKIHVFDHDNLSKPSLSFFGNYKLLLRNAEHGNYLNRFLFVYTPNLCYHNVSYINKYLQTLAGTSSVRTSPPSEEAFNNNNLVLHRI